MSNDDRDTSTEGSVMSNWTDEDMAKVAAEELSAALVRQDLGHMDCVADDDRVAVDFRSIAEAELLMTRVFHQPDDPGTLYDRATSGCVSMAVMSDQYGMDAPLPLVQDAFESGWRWDVHPVMGSSRIVSWHVSLSMSAEDAMIVTVALNSGVAL